MVKIGKRRAPQACTLFVSSVNKMISYLKRLEFIYPYHQAIGFYLERAGYTNTQLSLVEKIEKKYDFYLDYGMKETDYSKKWRLFYPKGF